jgi:hypothetical protein
MGLFRSRFNNNSARQLFHSSGVVGDGSGDTIGSTSAESFEQRKKVETSRRLVDGYRNAGIVHNYRKEAYDSLASQSTDDNNKQDDAQRRRTSLVVDRSTSRVRNVASSRIDIMKPSSTRVMRDSGVVKPGMGPARPATSVKRTFIEPVTRKYNPYQ